MKHYHRGHGIGSGREELELPSNNHMASAPGVELQSKIASMGLSRVAGNIWECKATKDFWKVNNGKIVRVTVEEVDNGDTIQAAPAGDPGGFLLNAIGDLTLY